MDGNEANWREKANRIRSSFYLTRAVYVDKSEEFKCSSNGALESADNNKAPWEWHYLFTLFVDTNEMNERTSQHEKL